VTLTPQWQELRFIGKIDPALAADGSNFELHTGYGSGSFEIADVRVENFGVSQMSEVEAKIGAQTLDYWGGQKSNDAWKKAAFERIEIYRKSDVKIRVVDAQGKPVRGATVQLKQNRHGFRFGSAVVAGRLIDKENPDNLRYQAEVARLFNTIVFENDLKWDNRNPQKTEQALEALKWLRANQIEARGHTLVWGSKKYLPADLVANWDDTEKVREMVRNRVRQQATAFKGQLYVWDVVNEAATNTELWEKLGWSEFANVFKIAREVDPSVRLAYNDYNIANESQDPPRMLAQRKRVAALIALLKEKGAPVDIYGDQAHFGLPLTPPARMVEIWKEAAKLGLSIEITEFDAGIPDDKLHGEYVRDALIAAFSVPQVESFIMWGFWEGAHWRAGEGGAMFRRDWSKRPAQEAYEKLVLNEWMTNAQFQTGIDGAITTRGFLGDYDVTITTNGKSKTVKMKLPKDGARLQIAL
jgi:GH35 family endo-1,4-beta-xylanase